MKLSIAKSVGKKIILIVACAVLLLIFASSGYGGGNGKYQYINLEHPWSDPCLSPSVNGTVTNALIILFGHDMILGFMLNGDKPTTQNIDQSNTNQGIWIKYPQKSTKRSHQR